MAFLISFAIAAATSSLLTPLVGLGARRLAVLDHPDGGRKRQANPVPLGGGVAVFLSLLVACLLGSAWGGIAPLPVALLCSGGLVCAVGCWDDLRGLRPLWKLLGQAVALLPLLFAGYWPEVIAIGGRSFDVGVLGLPLTVFGMLAVMNAVNFLDGMDGLCGLAGVTIAVAAALLGLGTGHAAILLPAGALAGAVCGFLLHNLPPARIYLGDSGSLLLGLWLAYLATSAPVETTSELAVTPTLLLLALPLLDLVLAIARRLLRGLPVWSADREHLHHSLLGRGLSIRQTLLLLGGVSLCYAALAWSSVFFGSDWSAWTAAAVLFAALVQARLIGHGEWSLVKEAAIRLLPQVMPLRRSTPLHTQHLALLDRKPATERIPPQAQPAA